MNRLAQSSSAFMASAYIGLASISLCVDLSQKVVNCFAIGAVLFAIADLIQTLEDLRAFSKKINDKAKNELKQGMNNDIFSRLIDRKRNRYNYRINGISILIQSFAFLIIIAYPFASIKFLEHEKIGVFCTIFSLGIMFFSRFLGEVKSAEEDVEEEALFWGALSELIYKTSDKTKEVEEASLGHQDKRETANEKVNSIQNSTKPQNIRKKRKGRKR